MKLGLTTNPKRSRKKWMRKYYENKSLLEEREKGSEDIEVTFASKAEIWSKFEAFEIFTSCVAKSKVMFRTKPQFGTTFITIE